ncbi:hypothetical protein P7C71_g2590, partial [Lecanoromycetidae sp. Uapishka_2]
MASLVKLYADFLEYGYQILKKNMTAVIPEIEDSIMEAVNAQEQHLTTPVVGNESIIRPLLALMDAEVEWPEEEEEEEEEDQAFFEDDDPFDASGNEEDQEDQEMGEGEEQED